MEKTVKEPSMKTKKRKKESLQRGNNKPVSTSCYKIKLFFPFDVNRLLDLSLLSSESSKVKPCWRCNVVVCEV